MLRLYSRKYFTLFACKDLLPLILVHLFELITSEAALANVLVLVDDVELLGNRNCSFF